MKEPINERSTGTGAVDRLEINVSMPPGSGSYRFSGTGLPPSAEGLKLMQPSRNWTQPLCCGCWDNINPDKIPSILQESYEEICCMCGNKTLSGIYYRVDPTTVPFPTVPSQGESNEQA